MSGAGLVSPEVGALAHADLLALAIDLWPYDVLAATARSLRRNLTMQDVAYAAPADLLQVALVTLDRRLSRAPGVRCRVEVPPLG